MHTASCARKLVLTWQKDRNHDVLTLFLQIIGSPGLENFWKYVYCMYVCVNFDFDSYLAFYCLYHPHPNDFGYLPYDWYWFLKEASEEALLLLHACLIQLIPKTSAPIPAKGTVRPQCRTLWGMESQRRFPWYDPWSHSVAARGCTEQCYPLCSELNMLRSPAELL